MYPTIIFFLALALSSIFVEATAIDITNKSNDYQKLRFWLLLIVCSLWSWLYYLSH